jgi:hypothetical protein
MTMMAKLVFIEMPTVENGLVFFFKKKVGIRNSCFCKFPYLFLE